jgi:hypothetical protein
MWTLLDNPEYESMEPRIVEAQCHDRTPFLTVGCPYCKAPNHMHESQFAEVPDGYVIGLRCASCRTPADMPIEFIRGGFVKLRQLGWIA